jgi:ABC-type multidrug transport system fused ATPase/permease subunit
MQTIRIIKLFAWEPQFSERILSAREKELRVLWQRMMMFIAFMALSMGGPVLIMSVTLGAYTTLLEKALTPSVAFTTVALFNSLRRAVEQFPEMLFWIMQCRVSAQRIDGFLSEEEVLPPWSTSNNYTTSSCHAAAAAAGEGSSNNTESKEQLIKTLIGFEHASFNWKESILACNMTMEEEEETTEPLLGSNPPSSDGFHLSQLTVCFPVGELTLIAGPTGSGKTSLLMALLGGKYNIGAYLDVDL